MATKRSLMSGVRIASAMRVMISSASVDVRVDRSFVVLSSVDLGERGVGFERRRGQGVGIGDGKGPGQRRLGSTG